MYDLVWLTEERHFAELIFLGAHYAIVRYTRGGIDYEVIVDNNEFEHIDERGDSDED
jgi:hypothetical protein